MISVYICVTNHIDIRVCPESPDVRPKPQSGRFDGEHDERWWDFKVPISGQTAGTQDHWFPKLRRIINIFHVEAFWVWVELYTHIDPTSIFSFIL